jgi:hypothetical protein
MYEMEGAPRSRGSNGPIARPANPRNPPPSLGGASANSGRLGARLPGRRLPRAARRSGGPCRETPASKCSLSRTPGPWCSLTLRFPPEPGPPSLVACEISIAAQTPAQEAGGPIFKILWDRPAHPQKRLRYPQAEARCPPVVHQFIHKPAYILVGTTVRRRGRPAGPAPRRRRGRPGRPPHLSSPVRADRVPRRAGRPRCWR